MTPRAAIAAGFLATLVIAAGALIWRPAGAPPRPPTAAVGVPRFDRRMAAIDRRTRILLDRCHARNGLPGLLIVVTTHDGRPALSMQPAARGVCAYRVGP